MKNLLTRAAKLFVAALMIFTLAPTKIVAEGTSAIAISNNICKAISVSLYKDEGKTTEIKDGSTTVTRTGTIYGALHIEFNENNQPTDGKLTYTYTFPENINVEVKSGDLMNGNDIAGTFSINNNKLTFTYDPKWIAAGHTNNILADFNFKFTIGNNTSSEITNTVIHFSGVATSNTITYDDGHVTGKKDAKLNNDGSVTFTITLNADKDCTIDLTDTMGDNLAFVADSFKLDGNTVLNPTINGQGMELKGYAIKAGKHKITYNATIKDPSLDTDNNNQIDGLTNNASWKWDKVKNPEKAPVTLSKTYNTVAKSGSANGKTITWTVTLNGGDVKADMNGYVFKDTLKTTNQKYTGTYTIKDEEGNILVSDGKIDSSKNEFSYTFNNNAGKKTYIVTYSTEVTDTATATDVKNTAEGTPSDGKGGHSADATVSVGEYVTKEITDKSQLDTTHVVSWKSTAILQTANDNFIDDVYSNNNFWFTDGELPVLKYVNSNNVSVTMKEGIDYTAEWYDSSYQKVDSAAKNKKKFQLTFKNTENVQNAIANGGKITVEYTTTCNMSAGTYTNTSVIVNNGIWRNPATADYKIEETKKETNIYKKVESSQWNNDLKAWKIDWSVSVNDDAYTNKGKEDLKGENVTITDILPAGLSYLAGSAKFTLNNGWLSKTPEATVEPSISKDASGNTVLTFTIPTSAAQTKLGTSKAFVYLKYSTTVDSAANIEKENKCFTNKVSGKTDNIDFGSTSADAWINHKVLDKVANYNKNNALIDYTITVNENGDNLVDGNTLTLTDTLDYRTTLSNSSVKYTDKDGKDISSECSISVNSTKVDGHDTNIYTITVPDSKKVIITYSTGLQGKVGDKVQGVTNTATLSAITQITKPVSNDFTIQEASGSTQGTAGSISIHKSDSESITTSLEGAVFGLYRINNLDSLEKDADASKLVAEKVGSATTNASGDAKFHDKDIALDSKEDLKLDTLYYFVEETAPTGYSMSDEKKYFMLSGTNADTFEEVLGKANSILKSAGTSANTSMLYNVYDKKIQNGSLEITKNFEVTGTELTKEQKDGITFTIAGPDSYSKTVTYSDFIDGSYTINGLKPGDYTVTESKAGIAGYTNTVTYSVENGKTAVTAGNTATVDITNTYAEVGSLKITKAFSGIDASSLSEEQKAAIVFTVTGPNDFKQTYSYSTFDADGSKTIEGLAAGDYTVTETGNAAVANKAVSVTYTVNDVKSTDSAKATVSNKGTATVGVTNTYSSTVGNLTISKNFEVTGTELTKEQKDGITFTIARLDSYSKTVTYSDFIDGSYTINDLKPGEYKVTESNASIAGYTNTVKYSVDAGKTAVTAGNTATVDITNTYTEKGSLVIKKTIDGDNLTDDDFKNLTFEISKDNTVIKTVKLGEFAKNEDGTYTYAMNHVDNGTYSVKETNAEIEGYDVTVEYTVNGSDGSSVDVSENKTSQIDIKDSYAELGKLVIKKTFAGDKITKEEKNGLSFVITSPDGTTETVLFSQFTENEDGTYSFTKNHVSDGEYKVEEKNYAIDGYDVKYTTTVNGKDSNTVTAAPHTVAEVDITNDYTQKIANLVISKTFDGDNITDEDKANLKFDITYPDGTVKTVKYSEFTDGKYELKDVPSGTYTVHEVNPEIEGYDVAVTSEVDGTSSETVTMAPHATGTVEIKDSYTKHIGNLVISKSFDGDNITDEDKANLKFEVTYPDGTVKTVAYSEFTDGKYTLENVPNGDYKVREVNPEIKGYDVTVTTTVDGKTSDTAAVATKATSTIEIKDSYKKRPTTPITPDTPTPTPSTPTTPERPTTPTTTDRPHTPNTGDQTNSGMAAGAFGFSMLIAGLAIFFKKKYSA